MFLFDNDFARVVIVAWLALCAFDHAFADTYTTVFPPVTTANAACGPDQLRVLSWADGAPSTICLTGQEVLRLAIPTCSADNQVVFDGEKYVCRAPTSIPTCTDKQYLSFDGASYACKSLEAPPTCTSSQVLTTTAEGYACVERTDQVPICTGDQFLTYNGSSFQCAAAPRSEPPTCGAQQYVTSINGTLGCADLAAIPAAEHITVSIDTLVQYHHACTDPFSAYMYCAAACSRYCRNSCKNGLGDGSCDPVDSGLQFQGGVLSEWNGVDRVAACTCFH